MNLSPEEIEKLQRIKFLEESKQELISWAKRQAWILAIVITVLGAFGVTAVIRSMVETTVQEKVETALGPLRSAAVNAQVEAAKSTDALLKLKQQRDEVQQALDSLKNSAGEIQAVFAGVVADINNLRAGLEMQSGKLQEQVGMIHSALGDAATKVDFSKHQKDISDFARSSEYTILIFYRSKHLQTAKMIEKALLAEGYRSSTTPTDFSELRKQHPPRTVYVSHADRGKDVLGIVRRKLEDLGLGDRMQAQQSTTSLRRGDVQILFF